MDLSHAETRHNLRHWLARENRAVQIMDLLKQTPPNARLALSNILERLLCDSSDEATFSDHAKGSTALVPTHGSMIFPHSFVRVVDETGTRRDAAGLEWPEIVLGTHRQQKPDVDEASVQFVELS